MKYSKPLFMFSTILLLSAISCSGGKIPFKTDTIEVLVLDHGQDTDLKNEIINRDGFETADSDGTINRDGFESTDSEGTIYWDGFETTDSEGITDSEGAFDTDGGLNCPGNSGCDCNDNSECYSGFCVETAKGHKCAGYCDSDSSCDDGYKCTSVANSGGDTVYICVYKFPKLCLPCKADADCATNFVAEGSLCVAWVPELDDQGVETGNMLPGYGNEGAFCGTPCEADTDCATGYKCKIAKSVDGTKAKQCVLDTGSCGCTYKASGLQSIGTCYNSNEFGTCEGTQQCGTDGQMAQCDAKTPKAEICNHEDDDCDGETDEGIDTQTDVNNCSECGIQCTNEHGDTECKDGICAPTCLPGFWDCDADPKNGCEGDLSVLDACGRCNAGTDCPDGFFCKDGGCVKKYEGGHACENAEDCAGGFCTDEGVCCGQACDGPCQSCGTGTCEPVAKDSLPEADGTCNGFLCDGAGACLTECQAHADCVDNDFCEMTAGDPDFHTCKPDLDLGGDCKDEGFQACKNNICADGVCCENTCAGTCHQCGSDGKCEPVLNAEDPDTCTGTQECDANGKCILKDGQACSIGNDCLSGICKDGVCCDTACDGPCETCTANGCEPVKGMDDDPECTGDNTCNAAGECVLKNGQECEKNKDCATGTCKADYDGTGKWCGNASQCFHNGTVYTDGDFSDDCWNTTDRAKCESGYWNKQTCGTSGCDGHCGDSLNGCEFHVKVCESGKCQDTPNDVDDKETMCQACGLNWAIGGDTASSSCCGDDTGEYSLTCRDSSANGACGNDDMACCQLSSDCVDQLGNCAPAGGCHNFGTNNKKSFCDNNQWQDPDESEKYCKAKGCGFEWLPNATGNNSKCCGDDPGEDFVQSAGPGRKCCYNGQAMNSGSTSGSLLCYNGQLYDCNNHTTDDSGVATTKDTCAPAGGFYCSADNTWKKGRDNGCSCRFDSTCTSGACKDDFDGSGAWCADPNQCMHNAQAYNSGTFADTCYNNTHKAKCVNGIWNPINCGSDTTCTHYSCESGDCKPNYKNSNTKCNSTYRCSYAPGNNNYNKSGTYRCQGYCDGAGNCDYAGSCDNCTNNYSHANGTCSGDACAMTTCNNGYADCTGGSSDGCEFHLDNNAGSCSGAVYLGSVSGDKGCKTGPSRSGHGEGWYKVRVNEDYNGIRGLSFKATLAVPDGTNYDLYLYDGCGKLVDSSKNSSSSNETVILSWSDKWGSSDSRTMYIHVVFSSGNNCSNWTLQTYGGC